MRNTPNNGKPHNYKACNDHIHDSSPFWDGNATTSNPDKFLIYQSV